MSAEKEAIMQRSVEILAEFHSWTYETGPCPIGVGGPWANKLGGLCHRTAALEKRTELLEDALRKVVPFAKRFVTVRSASGIESPEAIAALDRARRLLEQCSGIPREAEQPSPTTSNEGGRG